MDRKRIEVLSWFTGGPCLVYGHTDLQVANALEHEGLLNRIPPLALVFGCPTPTVSYEITQKGRDLLALDTPVPT